MVHKYLKRWTLGMEEIYTLWLIIYTYLKFNLSDNLKGKLRSNLKDNLKANIKAKIKTNEKRHWLLQKRQMQRSIIGFCKGQ